MKIYEVWLKAYHLKEMKDFYTNQLEMDLISSDESYFSVMAGATKLIFEKVEKNPNYHLCFRTNLDYFNHIMKKLLPFNLFLSNEEGEISMHWKGKQAYFKDPDGNILEMLERPFIHQGDAPFGWFDVSEVGMPVENVGHFQEELNTYVKDAFSEKSDTFAFYGDEEGVFVVVRKGRPWYPTEIGATIHPIKVVVSGKLEKTFNSNKYPYQIVVKKEWNEKLPAVQFRMARHTNQLDQIINFYEKGLGLKRVGEFYNHEDYDGVMFGLPNQAYHLEFTQFKQKTEVSVPSKDDLLVFYFPNRMERDFIAKRLLSMGYQKTEPDNPYWKRGGITFEDPDGFGVVLMNSAGLTK